MAPSSNRPGGPPRPGGLRSRLIRRLVLPAAALLAALATSGCIAGGPQITSISPGRGAGNVASNAPVRITFDRPVDRQSVASRLRLLPMRDGRPLEDHPVPGTVTWGATHDAIVEHPPLRPDTYYEVVLQAGYRDRTGSANGITHSWVFKTESAPALTGSSPAPGGRDVNPLTDVSLGFSRGMAVGRLPAAISISPAVPFRVIQSPSDPHQVLVAPEGLFAPDTRYTLTLSPNAEDVDGNRIGRPVVIPFTTGDLRPLSSLVTVAAGPPGATTGAGVWVVDQAGLLHQVAAGAVESITWWPDGVHLLLRTGPASWAEALAGSPPTALGFQADWAAPLGSGAGYLFLDHGRLERMLPSGETTLLASGVGEAALAPGQDRVAFTVPGARGTVIQGYDLSLGAQYTLQVEPGVVDGLTWSPDGTRLAYRASGGDPAHAVLRMRTLLGGDQRATVAAGAVGTPRWLPDSRRLVFSAAVAVKGVSVTKIFTGDGSSPAAPLSAGTGLPPGPRSALSPSPSPDGHQIAFLAPVAGGVQVFSMNADGTGVSQLTRDSRWFPYSCLAVTWTRS